VELTPYIKIEIELCTGGIALEMKLQLESQVRHRSLFLSHTLDTVTHMGE